MQAPEGDFLKGLLPDVLKQLGAGGSSLPQQIIKMGMQGTTVCLMRLDDGQGPSRLPVQMAIMLMLSGCKSYCSFLQAMAGIASQAVGRCADLCARQGFRTTQQWLAGFYRLLKSWGMDPGLEFKVAMEEAERLRAALVYGDADQDHTIKRISKAITMQVCLDQLVLCRHDSCLRECQCTKAAASAAPKNFPSSAWYAIRPAECGFN